MYCIYRITNCINGKTYIGQHKYKETPYDNYMGSGIRLKRAQKKYGVENFIKGIIIDSIEDKNAIDELEVYYITFEREHNLNGCYNIADGGGGSNGCKRRQSEETRKKISETMKGRHLSDGHKKKLAEVHKGKSSGMKGKKHSEEEKRKISEALKGNHYHSDEERRKISNALKGKKRKPLSEEHKERISETMKGRHRK